MKNVLILLILLSTPLISPGQGLPREVKEWCLAVDKQNHALWQSNARKDSIIARQDTLLSLRMERIRSYERDSINHAVEARAYKESMVRKDSVISEKDQQIKTEKKKTKVVGGIGIILLILALL